MTGARAIKIVIPAIKYGVALILMISGVLLSIKLISSHLVGELSFCFLILSSILVGILVCVSERLKEVVFGLKEWRVVLSEIKEKEERIGKVSAIVAEMAASDATFAGLMWDPVEPEIKKNWVRGKIKALEGIIGSDLSGDFITYLKSSDSSLDPESEEYKAGFKKVVDKMKK